MALLGAVLALLVTSRPVLAQGERDEVVIHVYKMRHQSADDAWAVVVPLLSPRGRLEVRKEDNTLVLRDSEAAIARILPEIVAFDHLAQPVDVELWLLRASGSQVSPPLVPQVKGVPAELMRSLSERFAYQHYGLIGSSKVQATEGKRVTFHVGGDYVVRFRLGTILGEQRLKLNEFEVVLMPDNGDPVPLMKTLVNVWMERPIVLGLSSHDPLKPALMVVVRCRSAVTVGARPSARPQGSPRSAAPGGGRP